MSRINLRIIKYLLLFWIFLCCITCWIKFIQKRNEENSPEGHFWVFTDSHVDIFYRSDSNPTVYCHNISLNNTTKINRKFGQYNCDTPIELLYSAFSAAKRINSKVDFIIWLGDAASHQDTIQDTIIPVNANISQALRRFFPETLIIPVLGNHDIGLKANRSTRFKNFYKKTKFKLLLREKHARRTFIKGGYYSIRYQSFGRNNPKEKSVLRFVVLNSAMFQPKYAHFFDTHEALDQISYVETGRLSTKSRDTSDAFRLRLRIEPNEKNLLFRWFNQTMSDAYHLNDRILLLTHAPFGIDEMLLDGFYSIQYEQKLLSILNKYSKNIIMCFTGHRHQDTFRVYSSLGANMGILGHPSLSPFDFLSDPSIRYYSYHRKSLILLDYEQYILNLIITEQTQRDEWLLSYRFSSWYSQPKELTSKTLLKLIHLIRSHSFYRQRFLLTQHYRENLFLTTHQIIHKLCALTLFNFDEFILCTKLLRDKQWKYESMSMNYSLELNVLINEQFMQYKIIYRNIAFIFVVCLWIIYRILYR